MNSSNRRLILIVSVVALVGLGFFVVSRNKGIAPDSPQYAEIVSAFYVGLGALESGEGRALDKFKRVTELAPQEAAGWANMGLLLLRNNQLEEAAQSLDKARNLAPDSAEIQGLSGLLESKRANSEAAIGYFQRAAQLQPDDLWNLSALADELQRAENLADAAKVRQQILQKAPDNLVAHLQSAQLATKTKDAAELKKQIEWLQKQEASWPDVAQEMFGDLKKGAPAEAPIAAIKLDNVLRGEERYRTGPRTVNAAR